LIFLCFRCVADGYCSLEQADFIQAHVEKKLGKLYKIEEITGKSLSKSLVNYDDNEDELMEEDNSDKKSSTNTTDENDHATNKNKPVSLETTKNNNKTDTNVNLNNQTSPSTPKSNLSPGEIKPISPSSLSEASPISN
jgi:hypothetical protein